MFFQNLNPSSAPAPLPAILPPPRHYHFSAITSTLLLILYSSNFLPNPFQSFQGGLGGFLCDEPDPGCPFWRVLQGEGQGDEQGCVSEKQDEGADGRGHEGLPWLACPCWRDWPWKLQVSPLARQQLKKRANIFRLAPARFETKFCWKSDVCLPFFSGLALSVGTQTGGIEALPKEGVLHLSTFESSPPLLQIYNNTLSRRSLA